MTSRFPSFETEAYRFCFRRCRAVESIGFSSWFSKSNRTWKNTIKKIIISFSPLQINVTLDLSQGINVLTHWRICGLFFYFVEGMNFPVAVSLTMASPEGWEVSIFRDFPLKSLQKIGTESETNWWCIGIFKSMYCCYLLELLKILSFHSQDFQERGFLFHSLFSLSMCVSLYLSVYIYLCGGTVI